MKIKTYLILIWAVLSLVKLSFSQNNNLLLSGEVVDEFLTQLYDFRLEKADSILISNNISYQNKILSAYFFWYKILTGEYEDENYKKCSSELDAAIKKIKQSFGKNEPEKELLLVLCYSFKARLALQKNNYIKSLNNLVKITNHIEPVLINHNQNDIFKMIAGLYYYFAGYISMEYPLFRVYLTFKPNGDIEKGLKLLETCSSSTNYFICTESNYFLMKINNETEKKPGEANRYANNLTQKHPDNIIFQLYYLDIIIQQNNLDQKEKLINSINNSIRNNPELTKKQKCYLSGLLNIKPIEDTTNLPGL